MIDARKLLRQTLAWEALKRALVDREMRIDSINQMLGMASTASLEPEPIPLDVKVVLFGSRDLYYLLHDHEFRELFKVAVDFEENVELNDDTLLAYARLIATVAKSDRMAPFEAHASRLFSNMSRDSPTTTRNSARTCKVSRT